MSKFCTSCGTDNINEAKFCRSCGTVLEDIAKNKTKKESIKPEKNEVKKEPKVAKEIDYSKIGGWLTLYAIMLVFGIIASLAKVIEDSSQTTIDMFYPSQNQSIIDDYNMLIMLGIFHLFFISFVALSFFTKHPKTRIIVIIFSIVSSITNTLYIFLVFSLSTENPLGAETLPKIVGSILWTITWLLYFIFSKRVKKTFVDSKSNEESNRKMMIFVLIALIMPSIILFSYKDKTDKFTSVKVQQTVSNKSMKVEEKDNYISSEIRLSENNIKNHTTTVDSRKKYTLQDYYNLGFLNYKKENYSEALKFYGKACDGGLGVGCQGLGVMYQYGLGVHASNTKSLSLFTKSCNLGSFVGCRGKEQMIIQMKRLENKTHQLSEEEICLNGNILICTNLAYAYDYGEGKKQNYVKAHKLYKKACDGGNLTACNNLGVMYYEGRGVTKSYTQAHKLYKKACDGGNITACNNLR